MITRRGAAFTDAADGDISDPLTRAAVAARLGIPTKWAEAHQVHGRRVVEAAAPGLLGDADALITGHRDLPILVRTADCVGVVLHGERTVGVAHAGWRGASAGVVPAVLDAMRIGGDPARRGVIGPFIGPCCFEVGDEVAEEFPFAVAETTWGTMSVDLGVVIRRQLDGVAHVFVGGCTRCDDAFLSHRRDGTTARMGTIGWVP